MKDFIIIVLLIILLAVSCEVKVNLGNNRDRENKVGAYARGWTDGNNAVVQEINQGTLDNQKIRLQWIVDSVKFRKEILEP